MKLKEIIKVYPYLFEVALRDSGVCLNDGEEMLLVLSENLEWYKAATIMAGMPCTDTWFYQGKDGEIHPLSDGEYLAQNYTQEIETWVKNQTISNFLLQYQTFMQIESLKEIVINILSSALNEE